MRGREGVPRAHHRRDLRRGGGEQGRLLRLLREQGRAPRCVAGGWTAAPRCPRPERVPVAQCPQGAAHAARGSAAVSVQVRRVYEDPEPDGGARVLVDRLWPRGVAKEDLNLDRWAREAAPSTEL